VPGSASCEGIGRDPEPEQPIRRGYEEKGRVYRAELHVVGFEAGKYINGIRRSDCEEDECDGELLLQE
jgi:hypothetical protein